MKFDKLTRDSSGKRTDKTGQRDLTFSQWHRNFLSNRCYVTDIDFYEYRIERDRRIIPKALLEVKRAHVKQRKYLCSANSQAILELAQRARLKFLIILYEPVNETSSEYCFWVWEVQSESQLKDYSESQFHRYFKKYTNEDFIRMLEQM